MKYIVTGGAGFLGTHLCRALAKLGHEVVVIDLVENPEFETIIANVCDQELMDKHITDADAVFHLAGLIQAGESVQKPQLYVDYNISGTVNVLEAMRKNGVKTIIFSSSAAVYGEPLQVPITEDDRTIPINPYGMTKLAMEGLVSSYVQAHGITGVALRYFNLFGPEEHHQPETHVIPRFMDQILSGEEVTVWGSGEHLRDYIYISDIVDAHIKAVEFTQHNPGGYHYFNLSTENPASVLDIIALLEQYLGKKARITHFPDRPGDPLKLFAQASKAHQQLGWKAAVSLAEGLKITVDEFLLQQQ